MTLTNSCSSVRVCCVRRKFITLALFFKKSVQLLAYADDIVIVRRAKRDVTAAFNGIEWEPIKMDLAVNAAKQCKFYRQAKSCAIVILGLRPITILLIQPRNLFTLTPPLPPKMSVSLEIKRRITLDNRCYYGLNGQLSNRDAHPTRASL